MENAHCKKNTSDDCGDCPLREKCQRGLWRMPIAREMPTRTVENAHCEKNANEDCGECPLREKCQRPLWRRLIASLRGRGMKCQLIHYVHVDHNAFFTLCGKLSSLILRCHRGEIKADGGIRAILTLACAEAKPWSSGEGIWIIKLNGKERGRWQWITEECSRKLCAP